MTLTVIWQLATFLHMAYKVIGIPISQKIHPLPVQDGEVTGHRCNNREGTIGFIDEKWTKWNNTIQSVLNAHRVPITFALLMKAVGGAQHVAQLFPYLRAYFNPLSRFIGLVGTLAHSNSVQETKRKWRTLKTKPVQVPAILLQLLEQGWRRAMERKTIKAVLLLRTKFDWKHIFSTDAATGKQSDAYSEFARRPSMGMVCHISGITWARRFTQSSFWYQFGLRTYQNGISILESIASLAWLIFCIRTFRLYNCVILAYTDNTIWQYTAARAAGKGTVTICAAILAELLDTYQIDLRMFRANTKQIIADPISRFAPAETEARRLAWTGLAHEKLLEEVPAFTLASVPPQFSTLSLEDYKSQVDVEMSAILDTLESKYRQYTSTYRSFFER
jgi:hypothetical protein